MKKIIGFFALSMSIVLVSCSSEPAEDESNDTEVIVVPQTEKTETIIVEKEPANKATTIELNENGVKVETKKLDIKIQEE